MLRERIFVFVIAREENAHLGTPFLFLKHGGNNNLKKPNYFCSNDRF